MGKCPDERKAIRTFHGKSVERPAEYDAWRAMRQRCNNPNDKYFHNYGGRGITVDLSWRKFEVFLLDMGERPDGHSLERIDNNGPYAKWNCKWATTKEQSNNKSNIYRFDYMGEQRTIRDLSEISGIPARVLHCRLIVLGWSMEDAMSAPKGLRGFHPSVLEEIRKLLSEKVKQKDIAARYNVSRSAIGRVKTGAGCYGR